LECADAGLGDAAAAGNSASARVGIEATSRGSARGRGLGSRRRARRVAPRAAHPACATIGRRRRRRRRRSGRSPAKGALHCQALDDENGLVASWHAPAAPTAGVGHPEMPRSREARRGRRAAQTRQRGAASQTRSRCCRAVSDSAQAVSAHGKHTATTKYIRDAVVARTSWSMQQTLRRHAILSIS